MIFPEDALGDTISFRFAFKQLVHHSVMYLHWPGSQQCIVIISCDSGWTGIPDVRYDEAGTSGEGGGGGDDDEDDISFLGLFSVSYSVCLYSHNLAYKQIDSNHPPVVVYVSTRLVL